MFQKNWAPEKTEHFWKKKTHTFGGNQGKTRVKTQFSGILQYKKWQNTAVFLWFAIKMWHLWRKTDEKSKILIKNWAILVKKTEKFLKKLSLPEDQPPKSSRFCRKKSLKYIVQSVWWPFLFCLLFERCVLKTESQVNCFEGTNSPPAKFPSNSNVTHLEPREPVHYDYNFVQDIGMTCSEILPT